MRTYFDDQLNQLNREMIQMGSMIEQAIERVCDVLRIHDVEAAKAIVRGDSEIDRKERDIEALCLRLILMQQPVASDLRMVSSALKMITDMERIGDQAADIAEIIGYLKGRTGSEFDLIGDMARAAIKMVTESVDAFVRCDTELADRVISHDDVVDDLFNEMKKALSRIIAERPEDGEYAIDLLMIAKYFERIGDHAVNIAEWVVFSITGIHKTDEMDRYS